VIDMDTTRITDPISDRLPSGTAIVSAVTDVTSSLADQITGHVGEIDLGDTARRTRRTVARIVPWMSTDRSSRFASRRWLVAGVAATFIITVVVLLRRRSSCSNESPARDDWATGSSNGATPSAATARAEREAATASA
jgi:hypothetical protein